MSVVNSDKYGSCRISRRAIGTGVTDGVRWRLVDRPDDKRTTFDRTSKMSDGTIRFKQFSLKDTVAGWVSFNFLEKKAKGFH